MESRWNASGQRQLPPDHSATDPDDRARRADDRSIPIVAPVMVPGAGWIKPSHERYAHAHGSRRSSPRVGTFWLLAAGTLPVILGMAALLA
jgi:hypothetical protein